MQVTKTNAMRMLDADHISYEVHTYDNEDGKIHGSAELQETIVVSAGKIGLQLELPPEQLAATVAASFTEAIK